MLGLGFSVCVSPACPVMKHSPSPSVTSLGLGQLQWSDYFAAIFSVTLHSTLVLPIRVLDHGGAVFTYIPTICSESHAAVLHSEHHFNVLEQGNRAYTSSRVVRAALHQPLCSSTAAASRAAAAAPTARRKGLRIITCWVTSAQLAGLRAKGPVSATEVKPYAPAGARRARGRLTDATVAVLEGGVMVKAGGWREAPEWPVLDADALWRRTFRSV